jgi:hypothetical protein
MPNPDWNGDPQIKVTDPEGKVIYDGQSPATNGESTLHFPAGPKGVYLAEVTTQCSIWSSLDRSVLWTGKPEGHAMHNGWACLQPSVPRQWWFWVPDTVTSFTVRAQRASAHMSQREDWGLFIISPRGQRIRALWGQPPVTSMKEWSQDQVALVEVEPGAGGRFWSIDVHFGDSHNYTDVPFCFDGIPPYIARSPEEWFDPTTGKAPDIALYDNDQFLQSAFRRNENTNRWPDLCHFSACPSIGDEDGTEALGDGAFALWNPEGRDLKWRLDTYLSRPKPVEGEFAADVRMVREDGKIVFDEKVPLRRRFHGYPEDYSYPTNVLKTGKGVVKATVKNWERWFTYTYPATPLVFVGDDVGEGWRRFHVSVSVPRNWYFLVPRGTRQFSVRAKAEGEGDVMHLEICTPDRTAALIYDRQGERIVDVPPEMDGKIWHIRPDVGSASVMRTADRQNPRRTELYLALDLQGVPGYLAPTWEQWFDPDHPAPPMER